MQKLLAHMQNSTRHVLNQVILTPKINMKEKCNEVSSSSKAVGSVGGIQQNVGVYTLYVTSGIDFNLS